MTALGQQCSLQLRVLAPAQGERQLVKRLKNSAP